MKIRRTTAIAAGLALGITPVVTAHAMLFEGTPGDDVIVGTPHDDAVHGRGGADVVRGRHGRDWIRGEEGNDLLRGQGGKDSVHGLEGNDRLYGGPGRDRLMGDIGADTLVDKGVTDRMEGGRGPDTLITHGDGSPTSINASTDGGPGNDRIFLNDVVVGPTERSIWAGPGNDLVVIDGEHEGNSWVLLEAGDDTFEGAITDDRVDPEAGRDVVHARGGNDDISLDNDHEKDVIRCGPGHDVVTYDKFEGRDRLDVIGETCEVVTRW